MTPFTRLQIPFRKQFASIQQCKGELVTDKNGTVFPHRLLNGYKLFEPAVWRALRADTITLVQIYKGVGPHIDFTANVRLNVYIETNEARTTFYKKLPHTKPYVAQYHGTSVPSMFHLDELEYHSSFVANQWDSYLLDVKVPHSVNETGNTRSYIQFSWQNNTYEEVQLRCKEYIHEPVL